MADAIIRDYLDRPPYYGRSEYQHVAAVKELCGPTRSWDPVRKLWGTKCTDALQDLAASGKWHPFGIEYEWKGQFLKAAQQHRAEAQARWEEGEQAKKKKAAEAEAAAAALKRRSPASWLIPSSTPKKARPPPEPAPAPAATLVPPTAKKKEEKLSVGVAPSDAEVSECARLGFTEEAIAFSDNLNELGPRGTLSNEGRVLRWCVVLTSEARYKLEKEKSPDYFNPDVYLPAAEEEHRKWAAELHAQAKAHAAQSSLR